ncbi:phosphodiester glycosidase family protein [Microbacterium album]|uniref:Calcineurin-like phosphoesterase n=1 Tax=Microbacterium album TaxID=2053191 RepID=A0A917ICM5_9MICO|nr:phosphodiester glycosidase family protein [Microbacterium album]GGH35999.1 hypothetical protein GCM10010921_04870 [Microbacterium album]
MHLRSRTRASGVLAALTAATLAIALAPTAAFAAPLPPVVVDGMNLDSQGAAVVNNLERAELAPGLVHVKYERLDASGWQQVNILKAQLSPETVRVGYLSPETIAGDGATVTEMVDGAGAVAGINLDRFDINNSNAAAGWGVQNGEILKSGNPDAAPSIVIDQHGLGSLTDLLLEGSVAFGDRTLRLGGINVTSLGTGVALYTPRWGSYSRARVLNGGAGVEVLVGPDDRVQSVSETVGEGQLPEGVRAIVAPASRAEAAALRTLQPGDLVSIDYRIDAGELEVQEAGGAWHRILRDGEVVRASNNDLHPRTMVGFSEDGATAYFVQVDGRTAIARGMTLTEQGQFMKDLGAHNATNVDGGGSSQVNVRKPGHTLSTISNTPSDGYERRDGDGLGLFLAQPGSGNLTGFRLEAAQQTREEALRVFPGLSRTVLAHGHDEMNAAVEAVAQSWSTADADVASAAAAGARGIVTGVATGSTVVTAGERAQGTLDVRVLGRLDHLSTAETSITLETIGSRTIIGLTGHDKAGFTAPVEARDVTVTNPTPDVFEVSPTDDGRFEVTAIGEEGTARLVFEADGVTLEVIVAVPLEVRLIDDFSDISGWTTAHDRAPTGSVEPGEGHEGSPSIRVNYNFTESTGTRGRYAVAPGAVPGGSGGIDIPGRPQKLSVWVKGDGKGSLLRLQVMQANGVRNWIDGPDGQQSLHTTWTGWERQDFIVPESFEFPLKLERIRVLETVAAKQYTGSLEFSKIYAYLPPEGVEAPVVNRVEDPVIAPAGATDGDPLRVAVFSDAQFVARNPNSGAVQGAREALREIVASEPDLMLLNGDFVDEAAPEDFELARRILDEELEGADFPWYYLPGNHEIMGASINNFRAAFGDTYRTVDVEGTRFIMMNSATARMASEFAQVQMLRAQLDDAATNPEITGVMLVSHMPTNDPLPTKGSQLTDRNEAAMIDNWLQDFRESSGKSAAYIAGHVGVFHSSSVDGVPYVISGNSGKDPASTPANGGFTGWMMLGVDPAQGLWRDAEGSWLKVETKARVDESGLTVSAPERLVFGESGEVSASFTQDEGRVVPVAWPVSSAWGGDGVHVGNAQDAPEDAVVAIDPRAGTIEAVGVGTARIDVTVNGETAQADLVVAPKQFELGDATLDVTGTAAVGGTLTAAHVWSVPEGAEVSYRWLRDGEPIAGAEGLTYDVTAGDLGSEIVAEATVTARGHAPAVVPSNAVVIGEGELVLVAAPTVSGERAVGGLLTATLGEWDLATETQLVWLRDGEPIAGAEGTEYRLTAADSLAEISVEVTATAAGYGTAVVRSAAALVDQRPLIVQPAPNPGADGLDGGNRGGVSATLNGSVATLTLPSGIAVDGEWLSVYAFSTPQPLGWQAVSADAVRVDVSALAAGEHRLALYRVDGTLIGWAPITIAAAPSDADQDTDGATDGASDGATDRDPSTGGSSASDPLATTGVGDPTAVWVVAAVALLLGGAGLWLAQRVRARRQED